MFRFYLQYYISWIQLDLFFFVYSNLDPIQFNKICFFPKKFKKLFYNLIKVDVYKQK